MNPKHTTKNIPENTSARLDARPWEALTPDVRALINRIKAQDARVAELARALRESCDDSRSLAISEGVQHGTCGIAEELTRRAESAEALVAETRDYARSLEKERDELKKELVRLTEALARYRAECYTLIDVGVDATGSYVFVRGTTEGFKAIERMRLKIRDLTESWARSRENLKAACKSRDEILQSGVLTTKECERLRARVAELEKEKAFAVETVERFDGLRKAAEARAERLAEALRKSTVMFEGWLGWDERKLNWKPGVEARIKENNAALADQPVQKDS